MYCFYQVSSRSYLPPSISHLAQKHISNSSSTGPLILEAVTTKHIQRGIDCAERCRTMLLPQDNFGGAEGGAIYNRGSIAVSGDASFVGNRAGVGSVAAMRSTPAAVSATLTPFDRVVLYQHTLRSRGTPPQPCEATRNSTAVSLCPNPNPLYSSLDFSFKLFGRISSHVVEALFKQQPCLHPTTPYCTAD